VRSLLLGREIREESLPAGFLLFGEDGSLAREFLRELRAALSPPDSPGVALERFDLDETPWRDILDVARTMPFLFSPWRLLVVEIDGEEHEDLTKVEAKMLGECFAAPTERTLVIVIAAGKVRKTSALYKTFSALPDSAVLIKETKALKGESLIGWLDERLAALGKRAGSDVLKRIIEAVGGDLAGAANELEKLATYIGDKKTIDIADVDAVTFGDKEFEFWALSDALEKGDLRTALEVIDGQFAEGAAAPQVLGSVAGLLKNLLLAKSLLREKRERREIFKIVRPNINENWRSMFQRELGEFFAAVDSLSFGDLGSLIAELRSADLKIKTTDVSGRTLIESFVAEYCRRRKAGGITSPGRGRSVRSGG
jgi:DNA polymerase-3 subunit delta